jgi:putative peptidoglycan lipid II flippase
MLRKMLSVGGWTLLSRATGFVRDVIMAAVMGVGPVADAFVVALRIPNHFRAVFGEGAFNAAFVPAYARVLETEGARPSRSFAGAIFTLMLIVQAVLLAVAMPAMPWIVGLLAPGFPADPAKFALAVALTRITFPYLLFITLVTILSAVLNAHERFAAAAAAPVLLNLSMIAALSVAFLFPPRAMRRPGAWRSRGSSNSFSSMWTRPAPASRRGSSDPGSRSHARFLPHPRPSRDRLRRRADRDLRRHHHRLVPAHGRRVVALLRRPHLPAPHRRHRHRGRHRAAARDEPAHRCGRRGAAHGAQNRAIGFTLALTIPFFVAFLTLPELIMAALFQRGAFDEAAAAAAGAVLAAYAVGLPAIVLIRSATASFYARSDTRTPLIASLSAIAVNIALKLLLIGRFGVVGLALATAVGTWINLILLVALARRRRWTAPSGTLGRAMAAVLWPARS